MPFAYYDNLSAESRRTYRRSDRILRVALPEPGPLRAHVLAMEAALAAASRAEVESACQALIGALNTRLATPPIEVRVLERRPSNSEGELQGLYEPDEVTAGVARITVWMRTAQREQVVKFRTFLRTLVHEFVHHLDYELFKLEETFHTEGFYARESAMVKELLGEWVESGSAPAPARK
jgi:hypothetical protein